MLRKLMVFAFLFVPVAAFGQDISSSKRFSRELVLNSFTVSGKVDNIDRFFSIEFRWGVNDEFNPGYGEDKKDDTEVTIARFVPGVEFEYLEDSTDNDIISFKRYSSLVWVKGYLDFRPKKRVRPYVGGAMGVDIETFKVNTNEGAASVDSAGVVLDFLSGVRFYPHRRVVLSVSTKVWRPSVNFGAGFTF